MRNKVEDNIWWKVSKSNISFWFDNWTGQSPLYNKEGDIIKLYKRDGNKASS